MHGKQAVPGKNSSDIFNLKNGVPNPVESPNRHAGKRQISTKRDNDIFGIRERTTGEVDSK